ncbi:hypothetical protein SLS64_007310 [Diaporthe eres]
MDTVTRVTPRRTDELTGRATSTVQKDQARVLKFQLLAAPFTDGLNITDLDHGLQYGVNVTFGTQELNLVLDTGSSDTWAFSTATKCVEATGYGGEDAGGGGDFCVFGPPFQGDFPMTAFENMHFSTEYWGNRTVNGTLDQMNMTVGGLRVTNQIVGLAAIATRWYGRGPSSGVLGLAYPGLTKAFIDSDIGAEPVLYPPVISNMGGEDFMEEGFSLALNRPASGEDGGVIVFGGVPDDVPGVDWNSTAQTDIIVVNVWLFEETVLEYRKIAYNIDSGTPFICVPTDTANYIADLYIPPAKYNAAYGVYFVDCDAIAPDVAVVINDTPFWLNPEDLVMGRLTPSQNQSCYSAVTDCGWTGPYTLGTVFLQNVVAIFDVQGKVVEFASRKYY